MKTCKRSVVAAAGLAMVFGAASRSMGDKVSDALRKAPPAVQAAVIQLAGANKISEFDSETENGKMVYDLEYTVKGAEFAADIDPSGTILTREVGIDASILPPAVVEAANKAHPNAAIHEPAIVTAGDKMYYEVEMRVDKDTHEVQISPAGEVLSDQVEPPEAPESPAPAKPAGGAKEDKD
jgi:uncharacterized membrane protein YkoI